MLYQPCSQLYSLHLTKAAYSVHKNMNQFLQVNTYLFLFQLWLSRGNIVYVVTGLQVEYLRKLGVIQSLERDLALIKCPDWLWPPPPMSPVRWIPGALFQGITFPVCNPNHSSSCSAEVKIDSCCICTVPYAFMTCAGTTSLLLLPLQDFL